MNRLIIIFVLGLLACNSKNTVENGEKNIVEKAEFIQSDIDSTCFVPITSFLPENKFTNDYYK